MKYIAVLLCLLATAGYAQQGFDMPAQRPDGSQPSFGMPASSMQLQAPAQHESAALPAEGFSHRGLSHRGDDGAYTSAMVTSFGYGSMTMSNFNANGATMMQFGTGYIGLDQGAHSNLEGNGLFASVVPIFIGVRRNLAQTETRSLTWTQYAVAGAGPLMGIQFADVSSLWQTFEKMAFRWGAGAYAGLGSEMRFTDGIGLYAQLELTGYGFTAPLLDRQTYFGPSFSFGIILTP